jgi:hypothetical protein
MRGMILTRADRQAANDAGHSLGAPDSTSDPENRRSCPAGVPDRAASSGISRSATGMPMQRRPGTWQDMKSAETT